ncbi:enoyl-CoA hydratase/isomerase family protein [Natronorubrum sp. FCH18a]|uniref:enoyl-CoA hydratase/isomerase family protein n=1 Tax=Natronorubrum sp. FCH18a TaxID=3447018 RepID=UPI003F513CAF
MGAAIDYTTDVDCTVAHIKLNRPDSLNTLNNRLIEELCDALKRAEAAEDVRVIVLSGAGDEAFSAGYDITPQDESSDPVPSVDELLDEFEAATDHVHAVWECDKPVIAAVDGYCLAGGSDLAMACDLVFATNRSTFGYPGLRMAGVPPTLIYPFVMNLHEAKELLLSGKIVDADRAAQLGMVNRVVPSDQLMDAVSAEVAEIRKMPGNNVRILKHVLNGAAEMQGAKPMFKYSELFDALGHQTEYGKEYYRIATEDGFDAALEYMNEVDKRMVPSDK